VLDDLANPYFRHRRADAIQRRVRNVLGLTLAVIVICNITLMVGVSGPELHPLEGVRISISLCAVTAVVGTIVGFFLACWPLGAMPYLVKLPLAALAGTVFTNGVLAVGQALPILAKYLAW